MSEIEELLAQLPPEFAVKFKEFEQSLIDLESARQRFENFEFDEDELAEELSEEEVAVLNEELADGSFEDDEEFEH